MLEIVALSDLASVLCARNFSFAPQGVYPKLPPFTVRDNPDPGSQIDIPDPGFPIFLLIKYKGKYIPLYSEARAFFEPPAHIKNSTNVFGRKLRNFYP